MRDAEKWSPGKVTANRRAAEVWPPLAKGNPLSQNFPRC